ncbi:Uncharacterized protein SCF082_LOCUS31733, partial [Durusdinium trenchii]
MPSRKHEKHHPEIDFTQRGRELNALRDIRLNDPYSRLILFVLDTLLGSNWKHVIKSVEEIREITEIKRTTFYERIAWLQDAGLISIEDLSHSPRKRWRLIRSNIAEVAESSTKAVSERSTKASLELVPQAHGIREADTTVRHADVTVREANSTVRQADDPVRETDESVRETRAARRDGGEDGVICRLADLGVRWPTEIVEKALSRGCTPAKLERLIDHWLEHQESAGWGVAALAKRIQSDSPGLRPDQGPWPPVEKKRTESRERPSSQHQRCPKCGARPPHYEHSG